MWGSGHQADCSHSSTIHKSIYENSAFRSDFEKNPTMNKTRRKRTTTNPVGCKARSKEAELGHSATPITSHAQYACTCCSKTFDWKEEDLVVYRKLTSHTAERSYLCELCSETFINESDLEKHIEQCPVETPKAFESKCMLEDNARSRLDKKFFVCSFYGTASNWHSKLNQHTRIHTGEKPFKCSFCEETFNQKSHFNQHTRLHSGAKQAYTYSFCNEAFEQQSQLDRHKRTHSHKTGDILTCSREASGQKGQLKIEKTHMCPLCDKSFTRIAVLSCHMKEHDAGILNENQKTSSFKFEHDVSVKQARSGSSDVRKKPYKCAFCNKAFPRMHALIIHSRVHTGEKPYKCTFCKKSFNQQSQRVQHLRIHTGEKPYICSLCNKAFVQQSHLNQHWRLHTGEKPYVCAFCGSAFVQKCHLDCHIKIHAADEM